MILWTGIVGAEFQRFRARRWWVRDFRFLGCSGRVLLNISRVLSFPGFVRRVLPVARSAQSFEYFALQNGALDASLAVL